MAVYTLFYRFLGELSMKFRKKRVNLTPEFLATKRYLEKQKLNTVCVSAKCPNMEECFSKPTATFMILGNICTRACGFCSVPRGKPSVVDKEEPERIAEAVAKLKLKHAVITSVTRDDLEDGGAAHFLAVCRAVRKVSPETLIEILTPVFPVTSPAFQALLREGVIDIFNHNIETVPRLAKLIRKGTPFRESLHFLRTIKENASRLLTKSGLIVGLGETMQEIQESIRELHTSQADILTVGQYLPPEKASLPFQKEYSDEEFSAIREFALGAGIPFVYAGYFVRSSYNAAELYHRVALQHSSDKRGIVVQ